MALRLVHKGQAVLSSDLHGVLAAQPDTPLQELRRELVHRIRKRRWPRKDRLARKAHKARLTRLARLARLTRKARSVCIVGSAKHHRFG